MVPRYPSTGTRALREHLRVDASFHFTIFHPFGHKIDVDGLGSHLHLKKEKREWERDTPAKYDFLSVKQ